MNENYPGGTLQAALSDYLTWHALRGSSARHRGDISRMLAAFAAACGPEKAIAQVTRSDCEAFLQRFQERGCRPNTQKAYHRVLDAFFRWLVNEERLAESPMKRVPKPQLPQEQVKPLTPEELARLLAQPDRGTFTGIRDAALIAFLADTGLRITEALSVRLSDMDPKQRSVSVMGKGSKARTVFYGEAVQGLLRDYLRRRGDVDENDLLFVSSLGEPLCRFSLTRRIHGYGKKAGITGKRVSAHTLRHTFGVSWCLNGGDAYSLQRLMGHSTPEMTAKYVNFATGDLARLHRAASPMDRLGGQVSEPKPPAQQQRKRLV
jgi:site-specific recombinase XerD